MRLQVLMLGWEFPPDIHGGLGIATQALATALGKLVDLQMVLPREDLFQPLTDWALASYPNLAGKPTSWRSGYSRAETGVYSGDLHRRIEAFSTQVLDQVEVHQFDIIHAHDWMTFPAAVAIKERSGKPLVLHIHSIDADRAGRQTGTNWMEQIEGWGLRKADLILTVSEGSAERIASTYSIPRDRIRVIYHGGPDLRPYRQPRPFPEQLVVFLGRLTWQKGPDLFVEMALRVLAAFDRVRFFMVGDGDLKPALVRKVAQARVGDQVHFTGFLDREELAQVLAMANVCVLPSRAEPFGLAATEAASFGVPLVLSETAGVKEVLPEALYFPPEDIDQMAGKVMALLSYPDLARQLADRAKARVGQLSWDQAAAQIHQIYQHLID